MRRITILSLMLLGCFLAIAGIAALLYSQAVLHAYICFGSCVLPFGLRSLGDFVLMSYAGVVLIGLGTGLLTIFTIAFALRWRRIKVPSIRTE
jgi:hypothetical protein